MSNTRDGSDKMAAVSRRQLGQEINTTRTCHRQIDISADGVGVNPSTVDVGFIAIETSNPRTISLHSIC